MAVREKRTYFSYCENDSDKRTVFNALSDLGIKQKKLFILHLIIAQLQLSGIVEIDSIEL